MMSLDVRGPQGLRIVESSASELPQTQPAAPKQI